MHILAYFVLMCNQLGLTSQITTTVRADQMRTNLHANWSGFPRSTQQRCKHCLRGLLENYTALKLHIRQIMKSKTCGQCCFLLCAKLARSKKSLISAFCRNDGARIEIKFVLDVQSPRTVRTCHSVGTTRSREAGTSSSGQKIRQNYEKKIHW